MIPHACAWLLAICLSPIMDVAFLAKCSRIIEKITGVTFCSDNLRAVVHTATLPQRLTTSDYRPATSDKSRSVSPKKTVDFRRLPSLVASRSFLNMLENWRPFTQRFWAIFVCIRVSNWRPATRVLYLWGIYLVFKTKKKSYQVARDFILDVLYLPVISLQGKVTVCITHP